jgi:hypothetical protein
MDPIVLVELRRGRWFLIDRLNGYDEADLRAAFRILRRGEAKGIIARVRLMESLERPTRG